jgi:hypothetical protein
MRLATTACFVLILTVELSTVGCGKAEKATGPKTVPLRGKLVFTRGGDAKALFNRQGRIELESVDQPGVRAMGPIEEDGSFVVATVTADGSSQGAVPGTHRVRLDLDDAAEKLVAPQFLDFAKSGLKITVPSDQPIEVKVFR